MKKKEGGANVRVHLPRWGLNAEKLDNNNKVRTVTILNDLRE